MEAADVSYPRLRARMSAELMRVTVVAIDGPAGAGKSTVARAVADALGFTYLDSGAMYRAVALAALERGAEPAAIAGSLRDRVGRADRARRPRRDRRDPHAGGVRGGLAGGGRPEVREAMVAQQRRLLAGGDWVAEGRDIGTVVAPDAEVKVFLTADAGGAGAAAGRRARRRRGDGARRADDPRRARPHPRALAARAAPRGGRARHDRPDIARGGRPNRRAGPRRGRSHRRTLASFRHEGRNRRLSERRQVLAGQPAHRVA